jgi:hypothetical protein
LALVFMVVAATYGDEPTQTARAKDAPKPRSIAATAARGVALLNANDYEGFLREILPPADWQMIAGDEKLRAKFLRRAKAWDEEITMQLRSVQDRGEGELAFNGDRTEAVMGSLEHLEDGKDISHAIALRRVGDTWYLNWVVKGQEDFMVRARERERNQSALPN